MITFKRIVAMAKDLPDIEVSTSYGTPALKVRKKLLLRMHDKQDAIVLMLDSVAQQQELIAQDPMGFYITDHYTGYAAVLVRPTVEEALFKELLQRSWRRVAKKSDIAAFDAARANASRSD